MGFGGGSPKKKIGPKGGGASKKKRVKRGGHVNYFNR